MPDQATEAARWLAAARAGEPEILGKALEACRGYLLLIAQQELDPALQAKGSASDLVQSTMLEAVRDFSRFQGSTESELLHWLRRLLLNNLADFARGFRETDKRRLDREVKLQAGDSSAWGGGGLASVRLTPSGEAMATEQIQAIQNILARLPSAYRCVIVLRYQQEHSFDEIGRLLGLTSNAARKLLVRAVERVRQELDRRP
jgi:RNA polymerase sigma-70 factor (ECF subfamily)